MDGGAWQATVHGVAKSRTRLSNFTLFNLVNLCFLFFFFFNLFIWWCLDLVAARGI